MVFIPDNKLKQKMSKNGSVLQFMYSVAGAGKGLTALGGMLIAIGALLAAALFNTIGAEKVLLLAVVMVLPGILFIVLGVMMQQKKERGWIDAYVKATGLSEQELHQMDQEFQEPDTVLFSLDKGKDNNSLKKMGFITKNYIKFPGVKLIIFRLDDMVACFFTKKMLCRDGGYDHALIAFSVDGERAYGYVSPPEKASLEIVKEIAKHNPRIITDHQFSYEGKEYDGITRPEEVIALHKRVYGKN